MLLTPRQLNRTTLARQLLSKRELLTVPEALRRVTALQAQEAASPYVALWNRLANFDPAELDAAFHHREVVKATLMRITLHAVLAEDHAAFQVAMRPNLRASCLNDPRFTRSGLSAPDVDALLPLLLDFTREARSKRDIEAFLTARLGFHHAGVWWAVRRYAPLRHAPSDMPWSFGTRPAYETASLDEAPHEACVQRLVRRYLEAFGPATVRDMQGFTLLRAPVIRAALLGLRDELMQTSGPGGLTYFDVRSGVIADEDTPAPPRLMAMWDSVLLAYANRARIIPPAYRRVVIRQNGDVLPTVLVDGYVAGVWRPAASGIEIKAFTDLPSGAWEALSNEAADLRAFLEGRDARVYARYGHWWSQLPAAETRMLPA